MHFLARILFVSVMAFPAFALESADFDFSSNAGLDAQWRSMPLQKGAGDNVIKKGYHQGAAYLGLRLNDLFGLELGYQKSLTANRKTVFTNPTSNYFSSTADLVLPDSLLSYGTASIKGPYVGLLALLPISDEYRLKLIASAGMARLQANLQSNMYIVQRNIPGFDFSLGFSKTAWVPKLSLGLQHMINDHWGVRTMVGWEKTSKFKRMQGTYLDNGAQSSAYFASLKNSTTAGVGIFYKFF